MFPALADPPAADVVVEVRRADDETAAAVTVHVTAIEALTDTVVDVALADGLVLRSGALHTSVGALAPRDQRAVELTIGLAEAAADVDVWVRYTAECLECATEAHVTRSLPARPAPLPP